MLSYKFFSAVHPPVLNSYLSFLFFSYLIFFLDFFIAVSIIVGKILKSP